MKNRVFRNWFWGDAFQPITDPFRHLDKIEIAATFATRPVSGAQIDGMKKLLIPPGLAILLFLAAGCRKSAGSTYSGATIEGAWELRKIQASRTLNYDPGNGNRMKFSADRYEIISNGQVTASGTYEIVSDLTVEDETGYHMQPGTHTRRIIYDNNSNADKIFMEVTHISLTFFSGKLNMMDSGSFTTYVRN